MALAAALRLYTVRSEQKQIELVQIFMERTAVNQGAQFEDFVDDTVQTLQALASYPEIYEMNRAKQTVFLKGREEKLGFKHLFIMEPDGEGFYIKENLLRDQKNEPFFDDVMSHDAFIAEPFYTEDGDAIMTVCVSIVREGEKVGALCGAVNLSVIRLILRWTQSDKKTYTDEMTKCGNRVACMKMLAYLEKETDEDLPSCLRI